MSDPTSRTLDFNLDHVGIAVTDIERSVAFWSRFLEVEAPDIQVVDGDFVGQLQGYPDRKPVLKVAWLELPGTAMLELVEWVTEGDEPLQVGTAHQGAVHVCIGVADVQDALRRALAAGAVQVSRESLVLNGGEFIYLRDPDGVALELKRTAS